MCFVPQRRALFRHLDVKKWSQHVACLLFRLGNVLRATTASRKVVRTCRAFTILYWKCAMRYNGVHFFYISISKSGPNTRRFSEVTFRPSGAPNHLKKVNRDFPTFSRTCIFSLLTFFLFDLLHLLSSPP